MKKQLKKNPYNLPSLKKDKKQAIGQVAFEKLDSSPFAKSQRIHKRVQKTRYTDGIIYPCITYKEGYQYTDEYQEAYKKDVLLNNRKVI